MTNSSDPYSVLRLLQAHLEGRLREGQTRLWLTPEAAEDLRDIVRMKPRPRPAAVPAAEVAVVPVTVAAVAPREAVGIPGACSAAQVVEVLQRIVLPDRIPAHASPEAREVALAEVRARAQEGTAARALGTLRDTMVFAAGTPMAEILLVGEAPGAEEERQGEPFVGPAGQLLTRVLKVMGLERSQVYITNLCKYRPAMDNQGNGNRPPTPPEMAACLDFVREEIAIIQPKVIVALGGTAITGLLGIKEGVMKVRGRFYEFDGIPVMATLHPSYLLRKEQEGPAIATAEKRKFWEDMLMVMERAGLPVTEKQRAFFLTK